ncbi:CASP domain-containing protein [Neofusicoccum parvum]|uniref:CASP domain-containing protein n=1 Tax=Neofusicoccum parvum TaxID=310453 RepID=A0ACB5RX25_9PEZI|nr:CASP domain-containing protein [Neofusicoccum parvum]GME31627.1 CASP domain-containing protein [Neofusicoccum parvum]
MDAAATPVDLPSSEPASKLEKPDATANENKFQQAIAAWRNVNLAELMPALDTAAEELVEHQRDAATQRKDLAQKTKDFRKLDDQSKLGEIKGLLKAYQNYIDALTNQGKSINAAFFKAYTPLSEAPDPYPLLEASVDSLVTAEETVPKLTEENQRLQKTVSQLTTQLEATETKLEDELSARKNLEETRDAKIKEVEASWSAVLTEKQDNWEAKEKSLEEKVENQDRLLKELKASYEVSQRLGKGEDQEDDKGHSGATAAELEIVSSELDRANTRLAEVEARNEQLRLELAQSASNANSSQASVPVEDDPTFRRLQSENQSLLRKLEAARYEKDSERRKQATEARTLERELASLKQDRDTLREKVNSWGDYENVKRELEVLKSIEFATGEDDELDAGEDAGAEGAKGPQDKGDTLEQLLLARNKKLSNELTVLRVSHQDLQTRLEQLQEELSNTNMELEKSQNLAQTLENDLVKAIRAGEPVGGGSGILPMVTAQRDRFKKKNAELEAELQKTYQHVSSLRSEVASLQKDNLNLYEKTRYVSTYSRGHSSAYSSSTNPSTIQMTSDASSNLDRYRSAYEQNISPFAAFRGRESARAFKRMSLPERVVFRITKMVLATRTSRNMFAAYCVALHLLVFWMLLSGTSGPVEETISLSNSGSAAAAAAAGGGPLAGADANERANWQQEGFQDT